MHLVHVVLGVAFAAPISVSAQIINNFGRGTVRAGVTTGSSVTTSRENSWYLNNSYSGAEYSATGVNVEASGNLGPGTTYKIAKPGDPFQFSESYFSGGLTSFSSGGKSTETRSISNQLSVFSEIQ